MSSEQAKILVVDDEKNVLLTVAAILRGDGYEVDGAEDGASAIKAIRERHYDLVLTDLKMPGIDGLGVLAAVRKSSPNTVTMIMTGYGSVLSAIEAVQAGAYDYLLKPMDVPELKLAVQRGLEHGRLSEIDTLYRISNTVTSTLDRDRIVEEITGATRNVLHLANASLWTAADGADDDLSDVLRDPELSQRLSAGELLTSADDVTLLNHWAHHNGVSSYAFVPGTDNGRLICVLVADNGAESYEFHASARRFLQALARQAALVLANAALFAELEKNNRELQSANTKLQELDRLKSQFLNVATHELRTPLSIVLGYNSMLAESLDSRMDAHEREILNDSTSACRRLIRLVNTMLDISQIQAGKMRMNFSSTDLAKVAHDVAALFRNEAETKNVTLDVDVPSRLPKLMLDGDRIEQVMINLLANALKFTPDGGSVRLSLRHTPDHNVHISVADTGVGIDPEHQELIFDEFWQVRKTGKAGDGSGLGLSIAKRIIEAHSGRIFVTSKPGHGSTFTCVIPARTARGTSTGAVPA